MQNEEIRDVKGAVSPCMNGETEGIYKVDYSSV